MKGSPPKFWARKLWTRLRTPTSISLLGQGLPTRAAASIDYECQGYAVLTMRMEAISKTASYLINGDNLGESQLNFNRFEGIGPKPTIFAP